MIDRPLTLPEARKVVEDLALPGRPRDPRHPDDPNGITLEACLHALAIVTLGDRPKT